VISAKKKYEGLNWDGSLDTKGLAMVKKDSLPTVKYTLSKIMDTLNSDDMNEDKIEKMSPALAHMPERGSGYIKSLRRFKLEYTDHGIEVVNKRRDANTQVVTLDTLLERLYLMKDM
jgi:DNA polymerase elongation subunit (family B)